MPQEAGCLTHPALTAQSKPAGVSQVRPEGNLFKKHLEYLFKMKISGAHPGSTEPECASGPENLHFNRLPAVLKNPQALHQLPCSPSLPPLLHFPSTLSSCEHRPGVSATVSAVFPCTFCLQGSCCHMLRADCQMESLLPRDLPQPPPLHLPKDKPTYTVNLTLHYILLYIVRDLLPMTLPLICIVICLRTVSVA